MGSRLNKIKMEKENKELAEQRKAEDRKLKIKGLVKDILKLSDRVGVLLALAKECQNNDIDISKFFTSCFYHQLGFCSANFVYKEIPYALGINNGGACGNSHLRVSLKEYGLYVYGILHNEYNKTYKVIDDYENYVRDLENFIKNFDGFERVFLNYIDRL